MRSRVLKFGGATLANGQAIAAAVGMVDSARCDAAVAVIVSAPRGVTDTLLAAASGDNGTPAGDAALDAIARRFLAIAADVGGPSSHSAGYRVTVERVIGGLRERLRMIAERGGATPRDLDEFLATGERLSAPLFALAMVASGLDAEAVDATGLIVTDAEHGDAMPDLEASSARIRDRLAPLLDTERVPVVPGFVAAAPCGVTTTLGRGGSDYSAAILGRSLAADRVEFYKEVAGVLTADPDLVSEAQTVPAISHAELAELACFGARVVQYRAARLLAAEGIPGRVRSAFDASAPETALVGAHAADTASPKAVTVARGLAGVRVSGYGVTRAPAPSIRNLLAGGTSAVRISHASPEGESSLVVVPADYADAVAADLDRVGATHVRHGLAVVSVVGDGVSHCAGSIGRLLEEIGRARIATVAVELGGSASGVRLVVAEHDATRAVQAAHALLEPAHAFA